MEYDPNKTVRDFASRTRDNLAFIEKHADDKTGDVFEVTQLINSLLGLLVFPQQRYLNSIPQLPLEELYESGWPRIKIISGASDCTDLKQLVRYLRNSIAHFNVEFISGEDGEIAGMEVWNMRRGRKSWVALLSLEDIRQFTDHFIELLVQQDIA